MIWLSSGIIVGFFSGLTLRWTVRHLRPEASLIGVPLVAAGALLRLGLATLLLVFAAQHGMTSGLLAFAGLWLSRWIFVLVTWSRSQAAGLQRS
jgi:hypothetical protein